MSVAKLLDMSSDADLDRARLAFAQIMWAGAQPHSREYDEILKANGIPPGTSLRLRLLVKYTVRAAPAEVDRGRP